MVTNFVLYFLTVLMVRMVVDLFQTTRIELLFASLWRYALLLILPFALMIALAYILKYQAPLSFFQLGTLILPALVVVAFLGYYTKRYVQWRKLGHDLFLIDFTGLTKIPPNSLSGLKSFENSVAFKLNKHARIYSFRDDARQKAFIDVLSDFVKKK